jgi:eukaryotic-like serine/threonine-protein kinase
VVKIGDFGVARLVDGSSEGAAATGVGTPRYMAPEQGRGLPTTPATDVYSVGVVLHEMVTGEPPFPGAGAVELALRHLQDPPPALPEHVPAELAEVIARALSKRPEDRFADAGEMANAISAVSDRLGVAPLRARSSARGARSGRTATRGAGREATRGAGPEATTALLEPESSETAVAEPRAPRSPAAAPTAASSAPAPTLAAPEHGPRKNVNPSAQRRRAALVGLVLVLIAAMAAGGILLGGARRVVVPRLAGLTGPAATARLRHVGLRASLINRYSAAPAGTVIAQTPASGRRVASGRRIDVVLSRGPRPVEIPLVVGEDAFDAQSTLSGDHLRARLIQVAAPGVRPGTVTRQAPSGGVSAPPNSEVTLSVAETPRWRTVVSFAASGGATSVPFRIRGARWQVLYTMSYHAPCTFIFFCDGPPHAAIVSLQGSQPVSGFDLGNGSGRTQTIGSGPGVYRLRVDSGRDQARYSVQIQDFF